MFFSFRLSPRQNREPERRAGAGNGEGGNDEGGNDEAGEQGMMEPKPKPEPERGMMESGMTLIIPGGALLRYSIFKQCMYAISFHSALIRAQAGQCRA